jgi:hypothetical protein
MISRRHWLQSTLLGSVVAPWVSTRSKASEGDGLIIGHGSFKYRVQKHWCRADPEKVPVKDCHEMVQARDGRLFMLTNHPANNILVFDTQGRLLNTWTLKFGGAHGLSLDAVTAADKDFLWITDAGAGRVVKTSLEGEILAELESPQRIGLYKANEDYRPTETVVAPDGSVYVADGYGSQWILHYDAGGKLLRRFGGKSTQPINPGKFMQAHGVAIDLRGEKPLVLCTARIRNEFHWFDLEGNFVRSVYLPGAYISRPVIAGDELYSGVCFGTFENDYRMWQGRGFVTILDARDQNISNPGGNAPVYKDGKLQQLLKTEPVFNNCHDVCVDSVGDLYVCQWNSDRVYPYKLERV